MGCSEGVLVAVDLSERQREVLEHAARGLNAAEIGGELDMAAQTARHHLQAVRTKLNARNTTHAVAIALTQQIIKLRSKDHDG